MGVSRPPAAHQGPESAQYDVHVVIFEVVNKRVAARSKRPLSGYILRILELQNLIFICRFLSTI